MSNLVTRGLGDTTILTRGLGGELTSGHGGRGGERLVGPGYRDYDDDPDENYRRQYDFTIMTHFTKDKMKEETVHVNEAWNDITIKQSGKINTRKVKFEITPWKKS